MNVIGPAPRRLVAGPRRGDAEARRPARALGGRRGRGRDGRVRAPAVAADPLDRDRGRARPAAASATPPTTRSSAGCALDPDRSCVRVVTSDRWLADRAGRAGAASRGRLVPEPRSTDPPLKSLSLAVLSSRVAPCHNLIDGRAARAPRRRPTADRPSPPTPAAAAGLAGDAGAGRSRRGRRTPAAAEHPPHSRWWIAAAGRRAARAQLLDLLAGAAAQAAGPDPLQPDVPRRRSRTATSSRSPRPATRSRGRSRTPMQYPPASQSVRRRRTSRPRSRRSPTTSQLFEPAAERGRHDRRPARRTAGRRS